MKNRTRTIEAPSLDTLKQINLNAAGMDIGDQSIYVCVPAGRDEQSVRVFSTFSADLNALADWLSHCGVTTVAMESTGVYWIPIFQILEVRGFEVYLVNAAHIKNVPGKKTDIFDCQWIQQFFYHMLKHRVPFAAVPPHQDDAQSRQRAIRQLQRQAQRSCVTLVVDPSSKPL